MGPYSRACVTCELSPAGANPSSNIPITVLAGVPDFSKKHPLETKWTLWFDNPNGKQKASSWGQTLRSVYTFDTVEDFWW